MPASAKGTLQRAALGAHVELGRYGRTGFDFVRWRVCRRASKGVVALISDRVLMTKSFDTEVEPDDGGDNRWRDCTLRHWLNSGAPRGQVDFGLHPPPDRIHLAQPSESLVQALAKLGAPAPHPNSYDKEQGFLRYFTLAERVHLAPVSVVTEVRSGYCARRAKGVDRTSDVVFLLSWDEYVRLPAALKGGVPSDQLRKDDPSYAAKGVAHWSRTPLDGFGVAVLALWNKQKARSNSGASCEWGVRPCLGLRVGSVVDGNGTETRPYRLVDDVR